MENQPKIVIIHPDKEIVDATKLIDRFLKKNNIKIKYSVEINSRMTDAYGIFDPNDGNHTKITINPSLLINDPPTRPFGKRFCYDRSLFGIIIHEAMHMIDNKFDLVKDYKKNNDINKCILNINSKENAFENLAESLTLYVTNPYFLRHINKEVYQYWSSLFHSPTRVSKTSFIRAWKDWDKRLREECIKKYGIRCTKTKLFIL